MDTDLDGQGLDHLEEELREARKLALLGQVVAGMTEDINSLFAAILARAELARDSLEIQDLVGLGDDLDQLHHAAIRGSQMVRQMLSFSRGERLQLQPVDLGEVVKGSARLVRPLLPEAVHLRVAVEEAPLVRADAGALQQILLNLALQARAAMPDGGRLLLRVDVGELEAEECRGQGWGRPGRYGRITISDTGSGMPPEVAARLFEPFFTQRNGEGERGLGMPLVYALMKQHRGFVLVDSEVGGGTSVQLLFQPLPRRLPRKGSEESGRERNAAPSILLVEPVPELRRLAERVLRVRGCQVAFAEDGPEARAALDSGSHLDLVIADGAIPGLTPDQLVEEVRGRNSPSPILFLTDPEELAKQGIVGADEIHIAVLGKPWSVAEFLSVVDGLVRRGLSSGSTRTATGLHSNAFKGCRS